MSCVLRIQSEKLGELIDQSSLKPYRFEHGAAHFQVSRCDFDDLSGQVRDAAIFLNSHRTELTVLLAGAQASGVLDFAVEIDGAAFCFAKLPAELVREAGSLGLAIELSLYPDETPQQGTALPSS